MPEVDLMKATSAFPKPLMVGRIPAAPSEPLRYEVPDNRSMKASAATVCNKTADTTSDVTLYVGRFNDDGATSTYGDATITTGSTDTLTATAGRFSLNDHQISSDGTLTSLTVAVAVGGTVGLSIGSISGGTFTERVRTTAVTLASGVRTINVTEPVYAGEVVTLHGTAGVYFATKTGSTVYNWVFANGTVNTVVANKAYGYHFTVVETLTVTTVLAMTLEPLDSYTIVEVVGHFLDAGCQIIAAASVDNVLDLTISGVEFYTEPTP